MSSRYFYYQQEDETAWIPALATARSSIQDRGPSFMTVLDLNMNITHESERDQIDKLAYWGDLYIDIDVNKEFGGIETAIVQVNTLIDKFTKLGVKPDTMRIYASGSKGFHLEIPRETFLDKEPKLGTPHLPMIYKEIVHTPQIYVDGIDPRVYSGGRGRMWRTNNVLRKNGKYKVQLKLEECRDLTPEIYDEMVSGPRAIPFVAPPIYCPELAVMYASAQDTVVNRRKKITKSKIDPLQLARWSRKPPTELQHLLTGRAIKEGAGWHPIAIQIAMAAHALGWSADETLERAEAVIDSHHGDGSRYDSPRKRQRELTRLYYYFQGGSGTYYEFALAPIRALLEMQSAPTPAPVAEGDEAANDEEEDDEDLHDPLLTSGVKIRRGGMFKTIEGNEVRASAVGFANVTQLYDIENHETTGYQADMYLDNKAVGNKLMPLSLFTSRQSLQGFALANGGASVHLSDAQVTGLAELFRNKAMKTDNRIYLVNREGLDYVKQPNGKVHAIYVSHETYYCNHGDDVPRKYALRSVGRESQPIESDVLHAPSLSGTETERRFLHALMKTNKPENLAKLLGWFSAAFVSQAIRLRFNQFPLLHIFGEAGAGKTKTVELMANMHYYHARPEYTAAAMLTSFAMKTRLSSSASIPVIWDEVKFHEMGHQNKHNIAQYLRNNYAAVKSENGTLRKDTGQTHVDLREYRNAAPLVFMGETMETETAIAERYVAVGLTKQARAGRYDDYDYCFQRKEMMGHIGKSLIAEGLDLDREAMGLAIKGYEKEVADATNGSASDDSRRIFNYAVMLYGLKFLGDTLEVVFPAEFGGILADMKGSLLASIRGDMPKNMSEASKVLDVLAFLTKTETDEQYRLAYGTDFMVSNDCVDLKLRSCYTKYLQYNRSVGLPPLFPDYAKFVAAMQRYSAVVDELCLDSPLKDTLRVDVFRFSASGLDAEGVELFKGQLGALK